MSKTPPCRFDLHIHTTRYSPDSEINPFLLMRRAKSLNLTGIVITEHDHLWPEAELAELRAATPEVQVYGGAEVSAMEGHFLVYGIQSLDRLPKGIALAELCKEVHKQGGVVIAAHPYRWGQDFDALLKESPALDGVEVMSKNIEAAHESKITELWRNRRWAGLGNSDAHQIDQLGCCYTEFNVPIRSFGDLIKALQKGMAQPVHQNKEVLDSVADITIC